MAVIKFTCEDDQESVVMTIDSFQTADTLLDFWQRFMLAISFSESSVYGAVKGLCYEIDEAEKEKEL